MITKFTRHCLWTVIGMLMSQSVLAQADSTKLWKVTGATSLGFSNVVLNNWAGGGDNSIALNSLFDLKAERETEKSLWTNTFNFKFGITRLGDSDNLFKKTNDQLILGTAYNYKIDDHWSLATGIELRTQAAPGYTFFVDADGIEQRDQVISKLFAPAYMNTNLGITYKNKIFIGTLSPLSNKLTFVLDDSLSNAGAFGVEPGKKVRSEIGPNFLGKLEFTPIENITFKSTLLLFANYERLGNIDVDWENLIVFKINKFFDASFGTRMIYDDDILIPQDDGSSKIAVQYSQVLSINFGYKF